MTEEIYNKATNLRSLIEKDKKALKYWKEAVDATEETITLGMKKLPFLGSYLLKN